MDDYRQDNRAYNDKFRMVIIDIGEGDYNPVDRYLELQRQIRVWNTNMIDLINIRSTASLLVGPFTYMLIKFHGDTSESNVTDTTPLNTNTSAGTRYYGRALSIYQGIDDRLNNLLRDSFDSTCINYNLLDLVIGHCTNYNYKYHNVNKDLCVLSKFPLTNRSNYLLDFKGNNYHDNTYYVKLGKRKINIVNSDAYNNNTYYQDRIETIPEDTVTITKNPSHNRNLTGHTSYQDRYRDIEFGDDNFNNLSDPLIASESRLGMSIDGDTGLMRDSRESLIIMTDFECRQLQDSSSIINDCFPSIMLINLKENRNL